MMERIADAAAKRLGLTAGQRAAYLEAILRVDVCRADGKAAEIHTVGVEAARAAGYVGGEHP